MEAMTPQVDCVGLALDLEQQAKNVTSQTAERAMLAAAIGLRRIDAHLVQPAQAVDVGGVLAELRAAADQDGATMGHCFQWWRLLTRALSGEKAGPVGDGWQPIETAPSDKRIIGCWLGTPGCHEVDVAVYVTQGVDRPRWVAPDDSFCEYGKPDLWMPLPQPPDSSDGMDYPDGPWAEGWAERSGVLLPASPTPGKEGEG